MSDTPSNLVTRIETEYQLLSGEARRAIADAIKIGGSVLAVLGVIQAALPHVGIPGADTASIAGIVTAATAALSFALRKITKWNAAK
jgi:hypothetical protein